MKGLGQGCMTDQYLHISIIITCNCLTMCYTEVFSVMQIFHVCLYFDNFFFAGKNM